MKKRSLKAFATRVTFSPVGSDEEKSQEIKQILGKAKSGEETTFLLTPEEFSKVFTSERLKLLRFVRNKPELSITEMAKALKRKREAVSRDIKFFEGLGLIKLEKRARTRVPSHVIQEISIRL